ncbi:MAG TPA: amidohydrolase family protein [Vicinamibacteria bacterium]|nr:amidohydrolase family protein [Vicinamibacteria bacterium]
MISRRISKALALIWLAALLASPAWSQEEESLVSAPPRGDQGEGPFDRLILRGATLIDGTGAMPRGPVDIVIEGNKIVDIENVGVPNVAIDESKRPKDATREIDAEGSWVLPGFVNLHVHVGGVPKAPEAEYTYKLWMAHGITTVRGVPAGPMNWTLEERGRSARNEIVAPRIFAYHRPGQGEDWQGGRLDTPEKAREWVRFAAEKGIDGLKLGSHQPEIMAALLDEAKKHGLGSTAHLSQQGVAQMNALDAVRLGLGTVTHFYGIFEALYDDRDVQPWPVDANYNNEQDRFAQVAMQWNMIHPQGSEEWNALLDEFLEHNTVLDPTMTAYLAGRDVMRERRADWHDKYTLPSLWEYYQPSRTNHGSYWYYWTTWEEVAWKNFFRIWMAFLDDYKDRGGRVTVSTDAAFIYNLWGFGSIEEMELLQEAGFHPLEVFRGATMHGAEALFEPKGKPIEFGVVRPGLLADLVVVDENPIANLKVLYGTGAERLNDQTGKVERVGGVKYTIKDGIVYDAKELLADVARMVERAKAQLRPTDNANN